MASRLEPYYQQDGITIYHADCAEILPYLIPTDVVMITDPPYGIDYKSNMPGRFNNIGIDNDHNTDARDLVIEWINDGPYAVFGTWKHPKPSNLRGVLIWDKGVHVGMGDLSLPWRPNWEEIYIAGLGWHGHRGSSVLTAETVVSWTSKPWQRKHPNEKPVGLMRQLIEKAPADRIVFDPYMGSGPIAQACYELGRRYVGVEIEEQYCQVAVDRLRQQVLF